MEIPVGAEVICNTEICGRSLAKRQLQSRGYTTSGPARPFYTLPKEAKSSLNKAFSVFTRSKKVNRFATPTKGPSALYCHIKLGSEIGCYSDDGAYFCGCYNTGGSDNAWGCHCGENTGTSDD